MQAVGLDDLVAGLARNMALPQHQPKGQRNRQQDDRDPLTFAFGQGDSVVEQAQHGRHRVDVDLPCLREEVVEQHRAVRVDRRCGFEVLDLRLEYGDQYLVIEARPAATTAYLHWLSMR